MRFYAEVIDGQVTQKALCEDNPFGANGVEITEELFDDTRRYRYENGDFILDQAPTKTDKERIAELEALLLQQQEVIDAMLNGGETA